MKRTHVLLVAVVVAAAASAAGYWVGLRRADKAEAFMHALRASFTSLAYLQAIRDGSIDDRVLLMEYDIDEALLANYRLDEEAAFRVLPPFYTVDAEASRRRALTQLADYRKAHPSPQRPETIDSLLSQIPESERKDLPQLTPAVRQSMLQRQQDIGEMVARYATDSSKRQ